jgi:hypothetical protein
MGLAVYLKRFKLDQADAFDRNHGLKVCSCRYQDSTRTYWDF